MKITTILLVLLLLIISCKRDSTDYINDNPEIEWIKTPAPDSVYFTDIITLNSGTILVLSLEEYIFRSFDNGLTWELIDLTSYDTYTLELFNEDKALIGTGDGIIISEDEGTTWSKFGLDSLIIREISSTHYNNQDFLVVGSHNRVFKSDDGGQSWTDLGCPEGIVEGVGIKNDKIVLVGKSGAGEGTLWVTQDGGMNWNAPLFHCLAKTVFFNFQKNIYVGASQGHWIKGGLYYSENDGIDWIQILPDSIAVISGLFISDNEIYVVGSGVIKVLDHSQWIRIDNGLPARTLTDIALCADGHLYVTTGLHGIFKSNIVVH